LRLDASLECIAVHGALDRPGRGQAITAQFGDKGHGFLVSMRNGGNHPLASWTASARARHFSVDPGFINEQGLANLLGMGQEPG